MKDFLVKIIVGQMPAKSASMKTIAGEVQANIAVLFRKQDYSNG